MRSVPVSQLSTLQEENLIFSEHEPRAETTEGDKTPPPLPWLPLTCATQTVSEAPVHSLCSPRCMDLIPMCGQAGNLADELSGQQMRRHQKEHNLGNRREKQNVSKNCR